ncbi:MAG: hypothetical protein ACI89J_001331 [Hyphomicrobiaceae bacterium]|jgi:hypothetical protein
MIAVLAGPVANASDTPSNKLSSTALHSKTDDPEMCAKRYHAKLGAEVLTRAQATLTIADAMRTPAAGMPGHWLFWDGSGIIARSARQRRLLATQQIHISENRMCVRSILARGGRIRCLKWKPIPAGYVPPKPNLPKVDPIKTEISPAERRIASQLGSRVIRKGAFAELEHGTAFYHMAQRTSDELIAYARQPYRATICNAPQEMISFYKRQLGPLLRKAARAKQLQEETHRAAIATAHVAIHQAAEIMPHQRDVSFSNIARELVKPILSPEEHATLTISNQALVVLQQSRDFISDQRFAKMSAKKRDFLRKALRNVEFAHYAGYNSMRWSRFRDSFETTFRAIHDAHRAECNCTN